MSTQKTIFLGAERLEHIATIAKQLDISVESVTVLADPRNPIVVQLNTSPVSWLPERYHNESRLRAFWRMLVKEYKHYDQAVILWFGQERGGVSRRWNLRNLILALFLGSTVVLWRGQHLRKISWRTIPEQLTKPFQRRIRFKNIASYIVLICAVFLAFVIKVAKDATAGLQPLWQGTQFVFRSLFGPLSKEDIDNMCAKITHFVVLRQERRLFADYFVLALAALFMIGLTVLLYIPCLLAKLFQQKPKRTVVALISHEAKLNGAPRSLLYLIQAIEQEEFKPILISARAGRLTEAVKSSNVPTVILPLSEALLQNPTRGVWLRTFFGGCVALPWLMLTMVHMKVQRVHINVLVTPEPALLGWLLPGVQVIWHIRDTIRPFWWKWVQITCIRVFSTRVITNSKHVKNKLVHLGLFAPKIQVVHNAIDAAEFDDIEGSYVRKALNIPLDALIIGCAGQITQDKGQHVFVKACLEIATDFPNAYFLLVGTLDNHAYVEQLKGYIETAPLSVQKRFIFSGFRTDIADILSEFDINVVPSIWEEPFGRVAMEGMWLKVPTVASHTGGLPEVIGESGKTGFLVSPGNVSELANVLQRLAGDAQLRSQIGQAGKQYALNMFTLFQQQQKIQQIYRYPRVPDTRLNHSRWWAKLRRFLPYRVRPRPALLLIYPVLMLLTLSWWLLLTPLFFSLLIPAMFIGFLIRHLRRQSNVAVLCYQTERNAGTRYRVTKPFAGLKERFNIKLFYPSSNRVADFVYVSLFYGHQPHIRDAYYWLVVYTNRLINILRVYSYDILVIQYELMNQGPMWMERLLARTHPQTIYDFDDSLYAFERYELELPKFLPQVNIIVAGNGIIADWAQQYNKNVVIIPTCVDETIYPISTSSAPPLILGWIGNPANLFYIDELREALSRLAAEFDIRMRMISSGPYTIEIPNLEVEFREWSLINEGRDIANFDIGLMPVIDDEVGRGKCGFKLLQYMAARVPAVASPVGVNTDIINNKVNGLLANTAEEWYDCLHYLISHPEERCRIAEEGYNGIQAGYTTPTAQKLWADLIASLVNKS